MVAMAFDRPRDARKSPQSGGFPPVKGFDTAGRRSTERPSDRPYLHGLLCRKALKDIKSSCSLASRIRTNQADHYGHINRS